jgi:adenylate kinase family enzyme
MKTLKNHGKYAKYCRFNVVGTSGSGKTTFSRKLANVLSLPYIELDQVFWKPNWEHLNDDELFEEVGKIISSDRWVLDGNYSQTTPLKWSKAECVIGLDYSFPVTVYRAVTRAVNRAATKKELWPGTGNKESFRVSFFSKESVILWTLQSYYKNKRKYSAAMESDSYKNLEFVRLCSRKDTEFFLNTLRQKVSDRK